MLSIPISSLNKSILSTLPKTSILNKQENSVSKIGKIAAYWNTKR